jgi:TolB protein
MMKKIHTLLFSASLLMGVAAHAQMRVEIAGVSGTQIPVAVAAFADESIAPNQVSAIIRADLERSGVFKVIDAGRAISDSASVDLGAFKASGADALVVGSVSRMPDGRLQVRYKLLDTVKQTQLSQLSDAVGARNTRLEAHRIADDVYEKLTGVRGIFSTRISYVKMNRGSGNHSYELVVADADGENEQIAAFGREAIISPAWSPDGSKVAYVSFEKQKPIIYVQNLVTGQRAIISNEKGSNRPGRPTAPSWPCRCRRPAIPRSSS